LRFIGWTLLGGIVIECNAQATTIPVPRPVIEWCLECQSTVSILYKTVESLENTVKNNAVERESFKRSIEGYKRDSTFNREQHTEYVKVISNNNTIITTKDKQIKKLKVNRWLERIAIAAGVAAIIIITKPYD
jgi:hypothetical protein